MFEPFSCTGFYVPFGFQAVPFASLSKGLETAKNASFSGRFSSLDEVLIAFNILRLVEKLGGAFVAFVPVGAPKFGLAAGGIVEDGLAGLTVGTGYNKVPFKGFTVF